MSSSTPPKRIHRHTRIALAVYLTMWTVATHWPNPGPLPEIPGGDKTIHLLGYLIAAFLLGFSVSPGWAVRHLGYVVALVVFAGCDEATQGMVNRSPSLADFAADTAGIVAGTCLVYLTLRIRNYLVVKRLH